MNRDNSGNGKRSRPEDIEDNDNSNVKIKKEIEDDAGIPSISGIFDAIEFKDHLGEEVPFEQLATPGSRDVKLLLRFVSTIPTEMQRLIEKIRDIKNILEVRMTCPTAITTGKNFINKYTTDLPLKTLQGFEAFDDKLKTHDEYLNDFVRIFIHRYLDLLYNKQECKFNGKFQYLLEDSPYDNIGHFTLRLLASTAPESWNHWLTRECLLLRHRLNHLLPRQLHRLFRNIQRRSKNYDRHETSCIRLSLITLSAHFLRPDVFRHIISNEHTTACDLFTFKVMFTAVPDLVKARKLPLERGQCIVNCSTWKIVLESLFHRLIQLEYNIHKSDMQNAVKLDPRLQLMSQRLIKSILTPKIESTANITASCIDDEARKFPPCMRHLHLVLRQKHRLSHHARFYYSLFLKDCGMNLENSIIYWRDEYSKPHICQSGCTHKWQENEKKFIYSIRHLYGLEGARADYASPNCQTILSADPGPRYEGGCPFKILDIEQLKGVFNSCLIDEDIQEELIRLKGINIGAACGLFLKVTNDDKNDIVIQSPVEYYTHVKNHV